MRVAFLIAAIVCLLTACEVDDPMGKYAQQIEQSKQEIEQNMGKFQDILNEVIEENG